MNVGTRRFDARLRMAADMDNGPTTKQHLS